MSENIDQFEKKSNEDSSLISQLYKIVCAFYSRNECIPFREPVDWKNLGLVDYPEIVKHPMDLGTIKKKIESNNYDNPEKIINDIRLVWSNCMAYNQDGSEFYHLADVFSRKFESSIAQVYILI